LPAKHSEQLFDHAMRATGACNAPLLYTLLILFLVKLKILQPIKNYFSGG